MALMLWDYVDICIKISCKVSMQLDQELSVSAMSHDYDVFEKFSDRSSIGRGNAPGWYEAERKMYELAEQSENEFYAIDIGGSDPDFGVR